MCDLEPHGSLKETYGAIEVLAILGFSSSLQTVLNGVIVMAFLVYTSNSYKLVIRKLHKEKLGRAMAAAGR